MCMRMIFDVIVYLLVVAAKAKLKKVERRKEKAEEEDDDYHKMKEEEDRLYQVGRIKLIVVLCKDLFYTRQKYDHLIL